MIEILGTLDPNRHSQMDVMGINGIMSTIDRMHEPKKIAIPIGGGITKCLNVSVILTHPARA